MDRFFPRIRLPPGEVERDRSLTRDESHRLIEACPAHFYPDMRLEVMLDAGWYTVADRIAEWLDRQAL